MMKKYKPTTPGQRGLVLINRVGLWKGKPKKSLTEGLRSCGGRDGKGRTAIRNRGGGHKRTYRKIDFKRCKLDVPAVVERLEYDPNRTAFIALIRYQDNEYAYILAPQRLQVGDSVIASRSADVRPGNAMLLGNLPAGSIVHNLEMKPGKGGQLARSAGAYAQLMGRDQSGYIIARLSSGEQRLLHADCMATVGAVSNPLWNNVKFGKAGRRRWLGRRPKVRGVAMNPVDHPHGGGEGKTSGGRHPVSPQGKPTKGKRTRINKRTDKYILRSRHQRRKR